LAELIKATSAGTRWGRLRLVVETDLSPCESRGQTRPARLSRRTRGCGGAGRKGFSDRNYPLRMGYAPASDPVLSEKLQRQACSFVPTNVSFASHGPDGPAFQLHTQ
jgi:hypothetical protein